MFNKMKWLSLMGVLSGCLLLSACVSDKKANKANYADYEQPTKLRKQTRKERADETTRIKTELAIAYLSSGNYRGATQTIESVLKKEKNYDMAWLTRAQIYQYLKEYDKADESFQRALKLSPAGAEINNNYGWFLCSAMNRPNDAIAYFDKAIADATYPTPEVSYLNKGICHAKMQQYHLADSYFQRALQMNPQFVPVFKERARAFLMADNIKEAGQLFRQYQSMIERLSADDLLLGWKISKHEGSGQAAIEYEMQLRELYPYSDELKSITNGDFNQEFGHDSSAQSDDESTPEKGK